jgi:hypothetical protein
MGKVRHLVGIAGLIVALVLVAGAAARKPHVPFQRTLGLHIGKSTIGVCVVRPPATSRLCTAEHASRKTEGFYGYGKYPHVRGHIVRFRVAGGALGPHTVSARVRFRAIGAPPGSGPRVSRWFDLPRGGRQLHEYPVHVPFPPGSRIGLDLEVTGDGRGEASAPIADAEGELNLNAVFEQGDQTPPVLKYTYAHHQDFLHTRRAYVRVRSNERVLFNPECVLLTEHVEWGLLGSIEHLRPGRWTTYYCELEPPAVRSARKAIRQGRRPRVAFDLVAYDRARNVGRTGNFYVFPTRP